ncbi:MAG: glycoside hydrolase family 43 protein [Acidimicrobiales bacterium]
MTLAIAAGFLPSCASAVLARSSQRAAPDFSTHDTTVGAPKTVPAAAANRVPPRTDPPAPGSTRQPALRIATTTNLPDPFVLAVPGGYELYASQTGLGSQLIPTSFTTRFGHWSSTTHSAMARLPSWATTGFTWAPDVVKLEGTYVMYFDSLAQPRLYYNRRGTGFSRFPQCIGTAVSKAPGGPFRASSTPLVCDFKAHGAIDPRTFAAPGGKLYLDWKSDDNAVAPAPYRRTHIYAQRLSPDGLSLAGRPHLLLSARARWHEKMVEAPDMVEARGRFWLFYSGAWFNSPNYGVGFASCAGPVGPCRDLTTRHPLIGSNSQGEGAGEESLFEQADGQWWILYSPWFFGFDGHANRPLALAPLAFSPRPYVAARASARI